jgi:hypothetical protein
MILIEKYLLEEVNTCPVFYGFFSGTSEEIRTIEYDRESLVEKFNNLSTTLITLCGCDFDSALMNKSFFFNTGENFNFNVIVNLQPEYFGTSKTKTEIGVLRAQLILTSKYTSHPTYFVSKSYELMSWGNGYISEPSSSDKCLEGLPLFGERNALFIGHNIITLIQERLIESSFKDNELEILSFISELDEFVDDNSEMITANYQVQNDVNTTTTVSAKCTESIVQEERTRE